MDVVEEQGFDLAYISSSPVRDEEMFILLEADVIYLEAEWSTVKVRIRSTICSLQ